MVDVIQSAGAGDDERGSLTWPLIELVRELRAALREQTDARSGDQARILELEAERAEARATNARLNRRAQSAEAAARENVEACRRAGVSIGRSLACWQAAAEADSARFLGSIVEDVIAATEAHATERASDAVRRVVRERDEALAKLARVVTAPCACARHTLVLGPQYVRGPGGEWHVADGCRATDGTVPSRPSDGGAS